jgi:hypothetical protein
LLCLCNCDFSIAASLQCLNSASPVLDTRTTPPRYVLPPPHAPHNITPCVCLLGIYPNQPRACRYTRCTIDLNSRSAVAAAAYCEVAPSSPVVHVSGFVGAGQHLSNCSTSLASVHIAKCQDCRYSEHYLLRPMCCLRDACRQLQRQPLHMQEIVPSPPEMLRVVALGSDQCDSPAAVRNLFCRPAEADAFLIRQRAARVILRHFFPAMRACMYVLCIYASAVQWLRLLQECIGAVRVRCRCGAMMCGAALMRCV